MKPYLSVIIPAFNEADRLGATLNSCSKYLLRQPYSYEIIVIDDGSTDKTRELVEASKLSTPNLILITLPTNKGKGAAVKAGMLAAHGEYRLFMDADNSTDISQIEKLLPYLEQGYDITIGSRRIAGAEIKVKQNPLRDFLGWVFRTLVHMLIPLGIEDTQNGFKLFSAKAAEEIFPKLLSKSWSFDVEVLLKAKKMSFKIKEVPIIWINDGRSKLHFYQIFGMLIDLLLIRIRIS
jgi:dolichyl-phosphate beta-glucosyltransferase